LDGLPVNAKRHASFALFIGISIAVFWKPLVTLAMYSFTYESSSHIILIPLVTIALIYSERQRIFSEFRAARLCASAVILCGVALYWLAGRHFSMDQGNQSLSVATLSFVLICAGGFLLCYGSSAAQTAAFPLLFLLLMVPLPNVVLDSTIYYLRRGSTEIAYLLFKLVGTPVLRQGFLLSVPGVTIEVAKECSGIRTSMALFITCLLAAHLFLRTSWKMLLFVLLAFPLAIIKNGIRITTLTLLSIYVDPGFLSGNLHRDGGVLFFLLALVILAPILLLLQNSESPLPPASSKFRTGTEIAGG
jgi:exosortase